MSSLTRVLLLCALSIVPGCTGPDVPADLPVQNLGLTWSALGVASGIPPLGESVAPISGFPGDGAAAAVLAQGWSSPGPVRWHGGQWVMPYGLAPGATLLNVSCDVWNPTTSAPANVLVEVVSSNGQVLGSLSVTPSTAVVFRVWPFVGTHAVIDGEQLVVRLSPKDAASGAWTSAAQDATVIGCAVNASARATVTHVPLNIFASFGWTQSVLSLGNGPQAFLESSVAGAAYVWVPSVSGSSLSSITFSAQSTSQATFTTVKILRMLKDSGGAQLVRSLSPMPALSGSWSDVTIDAADAQVVDDGDIAIQFDAAGPGLRVKNIRAVFR